MGGQALEQVLFFALLLFGLYFLAIRPQRVRARALQAVQARARVGSSVVTSAGLLGTITELTQERVRLQVAPGVEIELLRGALVQVLDDDLDIDLDPGPAPEA